MINFMIRTSNLKHLLKVVGHIRWVGLHSGPLRQNPPPIAAPHHPFVLILPPVRRHPILAPQEIAAFVDKGDIPLRHQAKPPPLAVVAIHQVQKRLQIVRTTRIIRLL